MERLAVALWCGGEQIGSNHYANIGISTSSTDQASGKKTATYKVQ